MEITNLPSEVTAGSTSVTKATFGGNDIGEKFVKIVVTSGSFKFNARGGNNMSASPDYDDTDNPELHFSIKGGVFYFQAASGSDTFNIEWL